MQVIKFINIFFRIVAVVGNVLRWLHFFVKECYISYYCYFSAVSSPNVATGQVSEILALEDITDEEVEAALASGSKETTPKGMKLKVP